MSLKRNFYDKLKIDTDSVHNFLVSYLKEKFSTTGFSKAVIGISGGVDSAVSAKFAVEALGAGNVLGVMLPYKTSNPQSISDAKLVINELGIKSELIEISRIVDSYCEPYSITDKIRCGNIMARTRMIVLYDLSAREKALVVGTSNKTETLVGYGTQFGDTAWAINPIGDLYKSQVWQIAEAIGIPNQIIEKIPSADLWEGQTDEGELGIQYEVLDALLYEMIDNNKSKEELVATGFESKMVENVMDKVKKNEFKSKPPMVPKIPINFKNIN